MLSRWSGAKVVGQGSKVKFFCLTTVNNCLVNKGIDDQNFLCLNLCPSPRDRYVSPSNHISCGFSWRDWRHFCKRCSNTPLYSLWFCTWPTIVAAMFRCELLRCIGGTGAWCCASPERTVTITLNTLKLVIHMGRAKRKHNKQTCLFYTKYGEGYNPALPYQSKGFKLSEYGQLETTRPLPGHKKS